MRRTEQAQGRRLMKFEEVYGRTRRGVPGQAVSAEIVGVSEHTFRLGANAWRRTGRRVCTIAAWAGSRRRARRWTRWRRVGCPLDHNRHEPARPGGTLGLAKQLTPLEHLAGVGV